MEDECSVDAERGALRETEIGSLEGPSESQAGGNKCESVWGAVTCDVFT